MKTFNALSAASLIVLSSAAVLAQDPVKVDSAHYKPLVDNATVRVLKIDYAPGAKSQTHQHPDTIVVPLSNAKVRFAMADGKSQDMDLANEMAAYNPAGAHSVTNTGPGRIDGILIEFKAPAAGTATLPTSRPDMALKVLAEGPRAMAVRTTANPTFHEPAGSKHDYDQVVIALGNAQMSLSLDGKPAKTTWARGDVVFIARGVPHEAKNASGKPVDFIIVAIK